MPCEVEHLQNIRLGQTLETLKNSPQEFKVSKKIIQNIKDKWSRKICNISIEYTTLEGQEKDLKSLAGIMSINNKRSKGKDDMLLGKRELNESTLAQTKEPANKYELNERHTGHNFTVRPIASVEGRNYGSSSGRQTLNSEVSKHLMRCRKTR